MFNIINVEFTLMSLKTWMNGLYKLMVLIHISITEHSLVRILALGVIGGG